MTSLSLGTIRYSGTRLQSSAVVALPVRAGTLSAAACACAYRPISLNTSRAPRKLSIAAGTPQ